jgi:acyl carrier protein
MEDVLPQLKAFIAATYFRNPSREIGGDEPLVSSGIIDSFGLVDLSLFVEDRFGVRINASDVGRGRADSAIEIAALIEGRRR